MWQPPSRWQRARSLRRRLSLLPVVFLIVSRVSLGWTAESAKAEALSAPAALVPAEGGGRGESSGVADVDFKILLEKFRDVTLLDIGFMRNSPGDLKGQGPVERERSYYGRGVQGITDYWNDRAHDHLDETFYFKVIGHVADSCGPFVQKRFRNVLALDTNSAVDDIGEGVDSNKPDKPKLNKSQQEAPQKKRLRKVLNFRLFPGSLRIGPADNVTIEQVYLKPTAPDRFLYNATAEATSEPDFVAKEDISFPLIPRFGKSGDEGVDCLAPIKSQERNLTHALQLTQSQIFEPPESLRDWCKFDGTGKQPVCSLSRVLRDALAERRQGRAMLAREGVFVHDSLAVYTDREHSFNYENSTSLELTLTFGFKIYPAHPPHPDDPPPPVPHRAIKRAARTAFRFPAFRSPLPASPPISRISKTAASDSSRSPQKSLADSELFNLRFIGMRKCRKEQYQDFTCAAAIEKLADPRTDWIVDARETLATQTVGDREVFKNFVEGCYRLLLSHCSPGRFEYVLDSRSSSTSSSISRLDGVANRCPSSPGLVFPLPLFAPTVRHQGFFNVTVQVLRAPNLVCAAENRDAERMYLNLTGKLVKIALESRVTGDQFLSEFSEGCDPLLLQGTATPPAPHEPEVIRNSADAVIERWGNTFTHTWIRPEFRSVTGLRNKRGWVRAGYPLSPPTFGSVPNAALIQAAKECAFQQDDFHWWDGLSPSPEPSPQFSQLTPADDRNEALRASLLKDQARRKKSGRAEPGRAEPPGPPDPSLRLRSPDLSKPGRVRATFHLTARFFTSAAGGSADSNPKPLRHLSAEFRDCPEPVAGLRLGNNGYQCDKFTNLAEIENCYQKYRDKCKAGVFQFKTTAFSNSNMCPYKSPTRIAFDTLDARHHKLLDDLSMAGYYLYFSSFAFRTYRIVEEDALTASCSRTSDETSTPGVVAKQGIGIDVWFDNRGAHEVCGQPLASTSEASSTALANSTSNIIKRLNLNVINSATHRVVKADVFEPLFELVPGKEAGQEGGKGRENYVRKQVRRTVALQNTPNCKWNYHESTMLHLVITAQKPNDPANERAGYDLGQGLAPPKTPAPKSTSQTTEAEFVVLPERKSTLPSEPVMIVNAGSKRRWWLAGTIQISILLWTILAALNAFSCF